MKSAIAQSEAAGPAAGNCGRPELPAAGRWEPTGRGGRMGVTANPNP